MFHAALRWPSKFDKSLWPLTMNHAVHIHNHLPCCFNKHSLIELWTGSKSTHSQLTHAHPWGCPTCVLDPRVQASFEFLKWDPRARQGVHLGPSPLHASTVGLMLDPNTNGISPPLHCIHGDHFETITHDHSTHPPNWDKLIIKGILQLIIELDDDNPDRFMDNWEHDETATL